MKLFINFAAFQLGWFSCVLGAANGMPWIGPPVVLGVVVLHLVQVARPRRELILLLSAMAIGVVVDSLLLANGWLSYANGYWLTGFAPYWIVAMWALFATTLNLSMRWMRSRFLLALAMGAVGGPLSYFAGAQLGAMTLLRPASALAALAVAWGLVMPLLTLLAARFDGVQSRRPPGYISADWRVTEHA